jgi:HEAT repeat protein
MQMGPRGNERSSASVTPVSSRSRWRSGLRTLLVVAGCSGVLWWTVIVVLKESRPAKSAIRAMGSSDPSERVDAIRELETTGLGESQIAIPPLIVALADSDARVRAAAAIALGPIGTDAVASRLEVGGVRDAIRALLVAMNDAEPAVRNAATNTLGYIMASGKPEVTDPRSVISTLAERLGDRDAEIRLAALRGMVAVGPSSGVAAPNELGAALKDELADHRAMAVAALAGFPRGLDPWLPTIFRMMEHDDEPSVRAPCADALKRLRPPAISVAAVPALVAALGRPDRGVRAAACTVLIQFGPEARGAIPALLATAGEKRSDSVDAVPFLQDQDYLAIQALGRIAPNTELAGEVITALTELLRAEVPYKWNAAVDALEGFGPAAASAIPELIRGLRTSITDERTLLDGSAAARALGRIAPGTGAAEQTIAALTEALEAGQPLSRSASARAVGNFGPAAASAIPKLVRMLRKATDPDPYGSDAAGALGCIAPDTSSSGEALTALTEALQTKSPMTRVAAVYALRKFGPKSVVAIPGLRALTKTPEAFVRQAAVESLAELTKSGGVRDQ